MIIVAGSCADESIVFSLARNTGSRIAIANPEPFLAFKVKVGKPEIVRVGGITPYLARHAVG